MRECQREEEHLKRERILQAAMALVGLLFIAGIYPLVTALWHKDQSNPGDQMMLSLYVTLGIFLLLGARNPSANRSLIAFTAWSSFAHGAVMTVQAFQNPADRDLLMGTAVLGVIGVALLALLPTKRLREAPSPAGA
jgi:uncharacterized membrane protein HdeD (DUF308 family)